MAPFPAYWCHCSANGGNPHLINTRVKEIAHKEYQQSHQYYPAPHYIVYETNEEGLKKLSSEDTDECIDSCS